VSGGAPSGQRVLVVEDEVLVAMLLEDMLTELGHEAVLCSRLEEALDAARGGAFHAAILDVNLDGQTSFPVAEALLDRGVPFAFATGYGDGSVEAQFGEAPVLQKPFRESELERVVEVLLRRQT
jgi:DNA-binding response OmpR family regulator